MQEPARFQSREYLEVLDAEPSRSTFHVSSACLDTMRQEAKAGYPMEVCGLLIGQLIDGDWRTQAARPAPNLNTERAVDRFQLDPQVFQDVDRELRGTGIEIIGIYHSHPDCPAKPSPTDLGNAWEDYAYIIVSVDKDTVHDVRCWAVNPASRRFAAVEVVEASP